MYNDPMSYINFISLVFHIVTGITLASALSCYNRGNFTTDSTYAENRALILSSLASNVTANGGFYTAIVGQGTDKVYGLVNCRGDSSSEACSNCVNSAAADMIQNCPNQKEAITWGTGDPPCFIHYANRSFFGLLELQPTFAGYNINNITSDMFEFDQIWSSLTQHLATKAAMGSSKIKFATEEADLTGLQKIYALMQCTPDISQSDCSYCFRSAAAHYFDCCRGKQGGYVHKPNCIFRWDLYSFYNSTANGPALSPTPSPSPPPPPSISIPSPANNTLLGKGNRSISGRTVVMIVVPSIIVMALVCMICTLFQYRKPKEDNTACEDMEETSTSEECQQFNYATIRLATDDFSDNNKLGQGGFGVVYKGLLPNGQRVAVKRSLRGSRQGGEAEFKNEVKLVARLQHRNLVRLLGFCYERKGRLLIYEFVPNSSLDHFIFDQGRRLLLNWNTRLKIIVGIARGMLYLHEDSQLRIIHRDLKVDNILLDDDMNPKISDFGTAKLFAIDQSQDTTSRIMGTFGYMAPEYAMHGAVSMKSDVFSFGMIILEMIIGQKNSNFHNGEEEENLLYYAWNNWNEGTVSNIIDPVLIGVAPTSEILRCIHIGLLCLQEDAAKRPTMGSVVLMLHSYSTILPAPSRPAYVLYSSMKQQTLSSSSSALNNLESILPNQSKSRNVQRSVNQVSITEPGPR